MDFLVKFIPYGNLPYESTAVAANMQSKLMPGCPYLPTMTKLDKNDSILNRTLFDFSVFRTKGKNIIFEEDQAVISDINSVYSEPSLDNLVEYSIKSPFKEDFLKLIKENNSKYAFIGLYGPFSLSQLVRNTANKPLDISDKILRKVLIQSITIKALSIIYEINNTYEETIPIIIFEEPLLNRFSPLAKKNPSITYNLLVSVYQKLFDVLHQAGAMVAIRSMDKCNWTIPINAGVDIISFDAYRNPHNLRIFADDIKNFISRGGKINYALVPAVTVKEVQNIKPDSLYKIVCSEIEELAAAGVPRKILYPATSISFCGDANRLPIMYVEKANMITTSLAKKIAIMQDLYR